MASYTKVSSAVAEKLGLSDIRNKTADGNYVLWQADVMHFAGDTLQDRANTIGGVVITPNIAAEEIKGTDNPIEVTTPIEYGGVPDVEDTTNAEEVKA